MALHPDLVRQVVDRFSDQPQHRQFVEAALFGALRRSAVVTEDVVDDRVVEDAHLLERVDETTEVIVGVLEEAGVHLHLAREDRLQELRHVVPCGDRVGSRCEHCVGWNHAELLLPHERLLAHAVPPLVEPAAVPVRPFARHVMRCVRGAGHVVHEERLVTHQGFLLLDPGDGLRRHPGHRLIVTSASVAVVGGGISGLATSALLARDGRTFTGVNVENASYGLTMCAERGAVSAAVASGVRDLVAVAIAGPDDVPCPPCGSCRQVLHELNPELLVVTSEASGEPRVTALSTLLPAKQIGSEFMPTLDEGDLMYMPTTYPGISTGKARELLQQMDKLINTIPEVKNVFGKAGRAEH